MTRITVNGEPHLAPDGHSVADLVDAFLGVRVDARGAVPDGASLGIAVAVNSDIVPRAGWSARDLAAGDAVEIVSATQGG